MAKRKHIRVGIWENAPFLTSVAKGIESLNKFLSAKDYELDYSLTRLDPKDLSKSIDILFLDGGEDVNPYLYCEDNLYSNYSEKRDKIEFELMTKYGNSARFSGVCRGLQIINVYHGGTLFQDIDTQLHIPHAGSHKVEIYNYSPSHRRISSRRSEIEDDFYVPRKLYIEQFIPSSPFLVSSLHHQAINRLSNMFIKTLQCQTTKDERVVSIIEGIENLNGRIRAVQSHPEFVYFPQTDGLLFSYLMHVDHFISANEEPQNRRTSSKVKLRADHSDSFYGSGTTATFTVDPNWTVVR